MRGYLAALRRVALVLAVGGALPNAVLATTAGSSDDALGSEDWPGQSVDVFGARVVDVNGQVHRLGVSRGVSSFIVVFIDEQCPISARYAPTLNELSEQAAAAGLQFYGVFSSPLMKPAGARRYVSEAGLRFPVLWDPSGDLALRLGPKVTPEAFAISSSGSVLYRGRIDNRFPKLGVLRNVITSHDLRDVIAALARGDVPEPSYQPAVGCFLEPWKPALPSVVTYTRDIAPIVNANCAECHRAGGIGPFPFESYEHVQLRARMMAHVTNLGIMPPWRAEKGYGEFRDERHLSQRQIDLIGAWARAGAPRGGAEQAVPLPVWVAPEWQLGEPDLIVEMAQDFEIPATGDDIYRYFVMPVELGEDRAIVAAEFRPGNAKVVHHSLAHIDYSGRGRKQDAQDEDYGFSVFGTGGFFSSSSRREAQYVYGWTPGLDPLNLPPDHGVPLSGGTGDAIFEIHYRPNGVATTDRSRMGLYFSDQPVSHIATTFVAGTVDVDIAPDDDDYWRQVYAEVPADIRLISVSPHMHYLGREVRAIATLPDGSVIPLLYIPDWDFRWQNLYIYRQPLEIPAGSRIDAWFKFDNSSANPYNPHDPPLRARWGWSSDEEMCELWMRFVSDDNDWSAQVVRIGNKSWSRGADVKQPAPDWSTGD